MSSYPLGSALVAEFDFLKGGVLTDPSPAPTISLAYKGDGSTIAPPALTHVATGRYRATVFGASDTTVAGDYGALAVTTDATLDFQASLATWNVGVNDVASIWNRLTSAFVTAGSIGAFIVNKLSNIGASLTLVSPLLASGTLALVQADDYDAADGASRAVRFLLTGTDLNLAGASVKLEMDDFEKTGTIAGAAPDYTFTFTLTSAETALFTPGRSMFQIRIVLANAHRVTYTQDDVNVTRRVGL